MLEIFSPLLTPEFAKRTSTIKFFFEDLVHFSRTRVKSTIPIRALDPQRDEEIEKPNIIDKTGAFTSQGVVNYVRFFIKAMKISNMKQWDKLKL
nr:hypothetical protein CFP56_41086 [Quercus suber]